MQLFLNTYGTYLHKKGELFEVQVDDKKKRISPKRISSIVISNAAQITTDSIQLALEYNIDIVFLDKYGDPYGRIWLPKLGSTTYIRRRLLEIYDKKQGLAAVKKWVLQKINNQIDFLKLLISKRNYGCEGTKKNIEKMKISRTEIKKLQGEVEELRFKIMGNEGMVSKLYFDSLSKLLHRKYKFHGRSYRPAKDMFNAILNYGFGVLYSKVEKAIIIAGLDPYIGILHTDNYNKKSLVFDMIEPYRIIVERPVFYQFSRKKVKEKYFKNEKKGVRLNEDGKKYIIPTLMEEFDKIVNHRGRRIKLIDTIQADCHAFANFLIGKRADY